MNAKHTPEAKPEQPSTGRWHKQKGPLSVCESKLQKSSGTVSRGSNNKTRKPKTNWVRTNKRQNVKNEENTYQKSGDQGEVNPGGQRLDVHETHAARTKGRLGQRSSNAPVPKSAKFPRPSSGGSIVRMNNTLVRQLVDLSGKYYGTMDAIKEKNREQREQHQDDFEEIINSIKTQEVQYTEPVANLVPATEVPASQPYKFKFNPSYHRIQIYSDQPNIHWSVLQAACCTWLSYCSYKIALSLINVSGRYLSNVRDSLQKIGLERLERNVPLPTSRFSLIQIFAGIGLSMSVLPLFDISTRILLRLKPSLNMLTKRIDEEAVITRVLTGDKVEVRADAISLGDLKHMEALYADVQYNRYHYDMCGIIRTCVPTQFTVSLELLSQLGVSKNIPLNSTPEAVFERLNFVANSTHGVNVNRYHALHGQTVVQNTVFLAYMLYKQMFCDLRNLNFPRPLRNVGVLSSMGTDMERWDYPNYVHLSQISSSLLIKKYRAAWMKYVFPSLLTWAVTLKVLLPLVQILLILRQQLQGFEGVWALRCLIKIFQ